MIDAKKRAAAEPPPAAQAALRRTGAGPAPIAPGIDQQAGRRGKIPMAKRGGQRALAHEQRHQLDDLPSIEKIRRIERVAEIGVSDGR